MIIGKFTSQADGSLVGTIDALLGHRKVKFMANDKGADYTVLTESGCEVGAAWTRTSRDAKKPFVWVKFDSPLLSAPINCALFSQKDGSHALVWDRDPRKPA